MAQTVEFMACKSVEIPIQKQNFKPKQFEIIDHDKRLVSGWATVEIVDKQGEIVPVSEMKKAMFAFMDRGGHVIFKHSNKPVGKVLKWDIEKHPEAGVYGIRIVAKIFDEYPVDNLVWDMIKQGKLKGFSIGATAKAKRMVLKEPKKGLPREVGVLHDLSLMEISLVEEPANPLALIEEVNYVAKGDDVSEQIDIKPSSTPAITREAQKKDDKKAIEQRIKLLESMTKVKELSKEVRKAVDEAISLLLKAGDKKSRYIEESGRFKPMTCPDDPSRKSRFCGCMRYMMSQGYSQDSARRICAKIYHQKYGGEIEGEADYLKAVDEAIIEVMKPFGKWENFDDCVSDMKSQGYDEESAKRICGKLQAELGHEEQKEIKKDEEDDDVLGRIMSKVSRGETLTEREREILSAAIDAARSSKKDDGRRAGEPKTDEERAMEHFGISPEEWEQLSEDEKRRYIEQLPPRGTGINKFDLIRECLEKAQETLERYGFRWPKFRQRKNKLPKTRQMKLIHFKSLDEMVKGLIGEDVYEDLVKELKDVKKPEDLRPPKEWFDRCVEETGRPALCGWIFYHHLYPEKPPSKREPDKPHTREARQRKRRWLEAS